MNNWKILKQSIQSVIKPNDNQEISAQDLQDILIEVINSLGQNATFAGIATPTTDPGIPDGPIFYIAVQPGVYSNFQNIEIQEGQIVLLLQLDSSNLWYSKILIDLSIYPKQSDLDNKADISILDNYATKVALQGVTNLTTQNASRIDTISSEKLDKSTYNADKQLLATKSDVDIRIQDIIGTAPEALDTLGEIAERLSDDSDAINAINGVLVGKANATDVDEVAGDLIEETSRAKKAEERNAEAIAQKVDKETVYTKAEMDAALGQKANGSDVYTKMETESTFAKKADVNPIQIQTVSEYNSLPIKDSSTIYYVLEDPQIQEGLLVTLPSDSTDGYSCDAQKASNISSSYIMSTMPCYQMSVGTTTLHVPDNVTVTKIEVIGTSTDNEVSTFSLAEGVSDDMVLPNRKSSTPKTLVFTEIVKSNTYSITVSGKSVWSQIKIYGRVNN